jgi:broad specificity polyphosphatase/5'/3'-nucleotidase SurE
MGFEINLDEQLLELDSDVHVVCIERKVAVTPLSLDLTSRVSFEKLETLFR